MSAPGWYVDPSNPTGERYWDGQQWTPQVRQRRGRRIPPWLWGVLGAAVLAVAVASVSLVVMSHNSGPTACSDFAQWKADPSQTSLIDDAVQRAKDFSLHADLLSLQHAIRQDWGTDASRIIIEINLNQVALDCNSNLS